MRLREFKVRNYRSIRSSPVIKLENNLTIIGPNNEGKSNLVRALVNSLQILAELAAGQRSLGLGVSKRSRSYQWDQDFPLDQQNDGEGKTIFSLVFELDDEDCTNFYHEVGSAINNKLPITISIGRETVPNFEVNKPGKGYAVLSRKSAQIAAFIGSRLSINYIPAVRTARDSARTVEALVSTSLRQIERTPTFQEALKTIEDLQRPVLEKLQQNLQLTLTTFVPSIKSVSLQIREGRRESLRSVDIGIDDGQLTPLANKGDGIISLVGMALLARLDDSDTSGINTILAIEEPESHLHPRAIHNIRSILDGLSGSLQVIITTHSPALVNRVAIGSNILVENNKAKVVSDISEIRNAMGVRISDNLQNSRVIVICEGANDSHALGKLLGEIDPRVEAGILSSEIAFNSLDGGGNLSYLANTLQNSICEPVCLLDDDQAGRDAFSRAVADGYLREEDVVFTKRIGKDESEFEDLLKDEILDEIVARARANLNQIPAGFKKKKFSVRAKAAFDSAGRPWTDETKARLKSQIAQRCVTDGISCIDPNKMGPLESLAGLLCDRLG